MLLLASSLAARTALADGADVEQAKRHFAAAETAYKLSQFKVAIEEYEAAYKDMPDPAFLFNIAQAHRQQYYIDKDQAHLQRALALYKSYLRESREPRNKQTVEKIIDELKSILGDLEDRSRQGQKKPGKLSLQGEAGAAGAAVEIDGKPFGAIPVSGSVEPGRHTVRASKAGYRPWSTTIDISAGAEVEIPVSLQPVAVEGREPARAEKEPVYKKWWFWTIVAGVAAGAGAGIGLGVYYGTRGSGVKEMPEVDLR